MQYLDKVAIIGAGTQGTMLAFRSLAFGKKVALYSRSIKSREKAKHDIRFWLQDWLKKGRLHGQDVEAALTRLTLFESLPDAVKDAEIVIENVAEILELKQQIWREISETAPKQCLLTTNSSSLKSSEIGLYVDGKERTFNVNFMTPTKDDMVEVMWNAKTSEETKALAITFLKSQGHVPVVTKKEIKGFSLNRVWRAVKKEALKLWAEGYTTAEDLDRAWMLEWGTPYGPFGLMDKVGLDIVQQIELSYYAESKLEDDLPPKALDEMVEKGYLGEKSGRGFYNYPNPAYLMQNWLREL